MSTIENDRHDGDKRMLIIVARDVVDVFFVVKVKNILRRVRQHNTNEANEPRKLHPQHEQWQEGKTTIYSVVLRYPNLSTQIQPLKKVECRATNNTRYDSMLKFYFYIGQDNIVRGE